MSLDVFGSTNTGLVREDNQDRFNFGRVDDNMVYTILCDGMGGENFGGMAAEISVNFAKKILDRDLSTEMTELSIRAMFSSIFSGANALVFEAAEKDEDLKGMGTTLVLAVLKDDQLYIGNVGDSRVYIANKKGERQITTDHTVVQMMIDKGQLAPEDASSHPKRHLITRAVGVSEYIDMDFSVENIEKNDIILACSDGLYNYLNSGEIYKMVKESVKNKSADNLIDFANASGGGDNITAVVMV